MRVRVLLIISLLFSLLIPQPQIATAAGGYASAPLGVTSTAIAGGVRVTWTVPTDVDNGITGYRVESSATGISGSWSLASTVASSIRSYDITGLSQVATYIRVAATTVAGTGTYGYPWTKLYRTVTKTRSGNDIVYESGYGVTTGDYARNNPSLSFTRIRYRMEDSFTAGNLNYADVDFYKWASSGASTDTTTTSTIAPTISNLQVLSLTSAGTIQTNVSDLNVYSAISNTSYYPNAITNRSAGVGRLEIWPWDYGTGLSALKPAGISGSYDVDDVPTGNSGYGSFQVHDVTISGNQNPIFAWNSHAQVNADIGFGNGVSPTAKASHPDWTFCGTGATCPQPNYFSLTIYVNPPVTPLVGSSTTSISLATSGSKGSVVSITATSNLNGFYTFSTKGKRIASCIRKATTGSGPYIASCSWRPTVQGFQQVTAVFSNTSAGYTGSQATATTFISKRTTKR